MVNPFVKLNNCFFDNKNGGKIIAILVVNLLVMFIRKLMKQKYIFASLYHY